jgi:DNA-binding NarL/FixJ family response regulator
MAKSADDADGRIRIALVNDYDVVVIGLARILERYADRLLIVEIDTNEPVADRADIVLYDTFAQPESDRFEISELVANPRVGKVAVYTWNLHPELIEQARVQGAAGYLSKALPARDLVAAIEAVHAGEMVFNEPDGRVRAMNGSDWPGRSEGLTDREAEVLALITQGMSNAAVADLTYLSPNTIKTYIRSIYHKIGATSRTQAVLWGVEHGFRPDKRRIDHWRDGP